MQRALTAGFPALAAAVLVLAAGVEIAFLVSPASSYCPLPGGFLSLCLFRPSDEAKVIIGLALGLTIVSVLSSVFAWRGRLPAAWKSALPGLIGAVLLVVSAVANQSPGLLEPVTNPPPADFWLYDFGGWVALAGMVVLAVACCVRLVIRFSQPPPLAGGSQPPGPPAQPA
jgi:hypothetical protein